MRMIEGMDAERSPCIKLFLCSHATGYAIYSVYEGTMANAINVAVQILHVGVRDLSATGNVVKVVHKNK